jgi:DNA polymerase III subunit gamma/tau
MPENAPHPESAPSYVVVARRYRPQAFGELIGQEHVSQALSNAIATHRVGHAYLFTGARGTGKTSTARILAKALNCVQGPTSTPCNACDICQSISSGDDVDVLEIDGASNRGIDEIRQLRQNVNVRPSRSRFKIYIIDEVHMLTREAFNALLKTLEEPPEHVKFIFCTTEATKIPITILSRCQRFDFAGISTRSIFDRLRQIVAAEGVKAEDEALEVLARRAAGSMRDSQSLLEQLLAFAPERITVADVHGMLGTAGDQRLTSMVTHLVQRNAAGALQELGAAAHEGVDVAQMIEQLFGYFRDCMVAAVGCSPDAFLYASSVSGAAVVEAGQRMGLQTILAVMQILDQALSRLRVSTQSRILAEVALVRICNLEDLEELSGLIVQLQGGQPATVVGARPAGPALVAPAVKKKLEPDVAIASRSMSPGVPPAAEVGNAAIPAVLPQPIETSLPDSEDDDEPASDTAFVLEAGNVADVWRQAIEKISGMIGEQAKKFSRIDLSGINRLTVWFAPENAICRLACQKAEQILRFEKALQEVTGQVIRVDFKLLDAAASPANAVQAVRPAVSPHQKIMEAGNHPLVRRATELFGAQPTAVEEGQ